MNPIMDSNARDLAKKLAEMQMRARDASTVMKASAVELGSIMRASFRGEASPSGEKWKELADSTIRKIESRFKSGRGRRSPDSIKKLVGDTNNMRETMFVSADGNSIRFGSQATSPGGFFYFLSHQFGAQLKHGVIPARSFFPVVKGTGKLEPMQGGRAAVFFANLRKRIARYITKGSV